LSRSLIADGSTRLLAIIGDPIVQVRAPAVWSALFRANSVNAVCIPMHCAPADLPVALDGLRPLQNLAGLIITIPHKAAAAKLVGSLTARAEAAGVVNILRKTDAGGWLGDIADGAGFMAALAANGQHVAGRTALVVGAGGVGTAIAFALAEAGVASVIVSDIEPARADALAAKLRLAGIEASTGAPCAIGYGIVINASPVGMQANDPLPIDPTGLQPDTIVGEVIMSPPVTPWVAHARSCGCFAQPGTDLMDYQIAEMAAFFGFRGSDWGPAAIARSVG